MLPRERKTAELPTDTVPPTLLASVDEVVRVTSHAVILGCCDTRPCPPWVINCPDGSESQLPVFPEQRTSPDLPRTTDITRPRQHVSEVPKHKVAALQPAARGQEPRERKPDESKALAGLRAPS